MVQGAAPALSRRCRLSPGSVRPKSFDAGGLAMNRAQREQGVGAERGTTVVRIGRYRARRPNLPSAGSSVAAKNPATQARAMSFNLDPRR